MLPSSLAPLLLPTADAAITKVLSYGGTRTRKPSGEVSAVRTMTLDGFDEISAAWAPILRAQGLRINLHAVFCHSRPHVTFPPVPHPNFAATSGVRRCELADLLIVIDHVDRFQKIDHRRAALVQAKVLKGPTLAPSGTEWVQHELLGWLPTFTFVDSAYDTRSRNLNKMPLIGSPQHTAEYGGIDLKASPPIWRHWLTKKATPWFEADVTLAEYIVGMVTGDLNFSRDAIRGGTDDWSFTVDELLRVTATRPITKKGGVRRGNDNVVGLISDTSLLHGAGGGDGYFEGELAEWPDGPLSTVHLTIRSMDDFSDD